MHLSAEVDPKTAARAVVDELRARMGLTNGWVDKEGYICKDVSSGHRERVMRIRKITAEEKRILDLADEFLEVALKLFTKRK